MGTTRIPRTDDSFNSYINSTANALAAGTPSGADRLGLTAVQAAQWEDYRTAWNAEYVLYVDESTRTKAVKNEKNRIRQDFIGFASPLLTAFSVHASLTEADRLVFKLPEPDRTPTARGKIHDDAYPIIKPAGGGSIDVKVRTSEDASRASRHPLADAVEVRYALLPQTAADGTAPQDPNTPAPTPLPMGMGESRPSVGLAIPQSALDCPFVFTSTKATFRIELGPQHSGKRFYAFVRWVNLSNPNNSGNWGAMFQTLVL